MTPFDPFEEQTETRPSAEQAPLAADQLPFTAEELDWLAAEAERMVESFHSDSTAAVLPEATAKSVVVAEVPPVDPILSTELPPEPEPESPIASKPTIVRTTPTLRAEHLYGWQVRNTTAKLMPQVIVRHELPANTACIGVSHNGKLDGHCLVWTLGDLRPGTVINLRVKVAPLDPTVPFSGNVGDFRISYVWKSAIRRPELKTVLHGPMKLEKESHAEWQLVVRNSGNGPTGALTLNIAHTPELAPTNTDEMAILLEPLLPEEEVTVTLPFRAVQAGQGQCSVHIAEMNHTVSHPVQVTAPALTAALDAPATLYLEREQTATLVVNNPGTSPTTDMVVTWDLPAGVEFVTTNAAFEYDAARHRLTGLWVQLNAGQTLRLPVQLRGQMPGDWKHIVSVLSQPKLSERLEIPVVVDFDPSEQQPALDNLVRDLETTVATAPALPQVRTSTARNLLAAQQIVFAVGTTRYAVPVTNVVEVGPVPLLTSVPHTPAWLKGVDNVSGDILPVVDLGAFWFGTASSETQPRLLVLKVNEPTEIVVGVLVDAVHGIRPKPEQLQPLPTVTGDNPVQPYSLGLTESDGAFVVVLDAPRLLHSPAMRQPFGAGNE